MPDSAAPLRVVLSHAARSDICEAANWGLDWFGERAVRRYRALMEQAFLDISLDPERAGSRVGFARIISLSAVGVPGVNWGS